tara:strand:+ start:313 stop:1155 length:843 start_codon:yes stop_codon:yes gene_type:complete
MITRSLLLIGSNELKRKNIETHQLDSEIILANLVKVSREQLLLDDHKNVTQDVYKKFKKNILLRSKLKPVAQIINKKEFWSTNFLVGKDTLIPRPETELMVEAILKIFKGKTINFLDVGTGSGCILLSLLKELKNSKGTGIDISPKSINVCKTNIDKLRLFNRARVKCVDFENFNNEKFDLIVSNPPYIPSRELANLSPEIRNFEPMQALNGGIDGLDLIAKVIYKTEELLKVNGILAIEIHIDQYRKASQLLVKNNFRIIEKVKDFKTNIRCILGTKVK